MEALISQLKHQIISHLNLSEIQPESVKAEDPLFGDGGLGLDSIDALELVVLLDKSYGVKITDPESVKEHFKNLTTLATFVQTKQVALA